MRGSLVAQTKSRRGRLIRHESLFQCVLALCKAATVVLLSFWTGLMQLLAMMTRTSSAHIVHV